MKTERFDKKLFKQEVLNNLKTQFRVELDNASQNGSLRTGWILRRPTKRKIQRFYIICPWNS